MRLLEAFIILAQLHEDLPTGCGGMMVPIEAVEAVLPLGALSITEYGGRLTNGGFSIRPADEYIDRMFPLAEWIEAKQRNGGQVCKRAVIVVENWKTIPKGAKS